MSDRDHITVVNAYSDVVDATVSKYDNHSVQVSAPGYVSRRIFPDFNRKTADLVLLIIDPLTAKGPELLDAAEFNLAAASTAVSIGGGARGERFFPTPMRRRFRDKVVQRAQDRIYVTVRDGETLANALDRTGVFRRVPSKLHKPHAEGFEIVGSWKTTRGAPELQVTLWRQISAISSAGRSYNYVAELDIDLRTGRGHVFEVARNQLTGGKTNPYMVNQMLSFYWGIIPFRLEPGE